MSWNRRLVGFGVWSGATAIAVVAVGGWLTRWGATRAEVARRLPGDDIVLVPQYCATNAITVDTAPEAVWPWLVQMGGYDRAGWYSYDLLDNSGVPSAWKIVPELQDLKVGDLLATGRSGEGYRVEAIDPGRSLVLTIREVEAVTSLALVLAPTIDGGTRLLFRVRVRARNTVRGQVYRALMEVGHVPLTRRTLLGIKARAERLAARLTGAEAVPLSG